MFLSLGSKKEAKEKLSGLGGYHCRNGITGLVDLFPSAPLTRSADQPLDRGLPVVNVDCVAAIVAECQGASFKPRCK